MIPAPGDLWNKTDGFLVKCDRMESTLDPVAFRLEPIRDAKFLSQRIEWFIQRKTRRMRM